MIKDNDRKLLIIHDPISPSNMSSHNLDIRQYSYSCAIKSYSRVLYSKSYRETVCTYKFLSRIINGVKIFLSSVRIATKATVLQRRYKVAVFNPNEDLITFITLLIIRKLIGQKWRLISRFICTRDRVLLNIRPQNIGQFQTLLKFFTSPSDKFSAETNEYADYLSKLFNLQVTHVPYPPIDLDIGGKSTSSRKNIVLVPGAARKDKGFTELPNLVRNLQNLNVEFEFFIQGTNKEWPGYLDVMDELQKLPRVKILPSYLSNEELSRTLQNSSVILLPYFKTSYTFRGSAFARRGMYLGKVILASEGTTMANDAELWGFLAPLHKVTSTKTISDNAFENYKKGRLLAKNAKLIWDLALQ